MNNKIGQRMKEVRNRKQITLKEIAEGINKTEATVQRYESGKINMDNAVVEQIAKILRVQPQYLMGWTDIEMSPPSYVPLLGEIAAGSPVYAEENFEDHIPFPSELLPTGDSFFLKVKGDSMEPTIPEASLALIRVQPVVENNEIAAVLVNGNTEATLKRIRYEENDMYLVSDNNYYMPKKVSEENPITIIGKAVRIISEVK